MYFTIEDYKKIEKWLRENSVKDTDFPETSDLSLNEQLSIIQDNKNKKTSLENLVNFLNSKLGNTDSELDINSKNPIENQAVAKAIYELQNRKIIKIVDILPSIDVAESNIIYILLAEVGEDNNIFTEWIKVNNTWEKVGEVNAEIDLSPYLKIKDAPFEKGISENSAVLKGGNNQVISEGGVALGKDNLVGLKGWYYSAIRRTGFPNQITVFLSKTQKVLPFDDEPLLDNTVNIVPDETLPNIYSLLGYGAEVSLVNDSKYDNAFILIGGGNGYVSLQTADKSDIPFTTIKHELLNDPEDYSIYCLSKPDKGMFDMGQGSTAGGYNNRATNGKATAFGYGNNAYGKFSFAEGRENEAGYAAHAEGRGSSATGVCSHAEGQSTIAGGNKSHAEGTQTETYANSSHAEGYKSIIKDGTSAHIEGYGNVIDFTKSTDTVPLSITGQSFGAHVEGVSNKGYGIGIHIEGRNNIISDEANCAHIEGENNDGKGRSIHIEGRNNRVNNNYSHAEGFETDAGDYLNNFRNSYTSNYGSENGIGFACHAEGNATTAVGNSSHAEGKNTYAIGKAAHAEGMKTWAAGEASHTEGHKTFVLGSYDPEQDEINEDTTSTEGYFGHAEGNCTIVVGNSGHAEGSGTRVFGRAAHAEGRHCVAKGNYSHAEGFDTYAGDNGGVLLTTNNSPTIGFFTHAEGHNTLAQGNSSHAEGKQTMALGTASHAEGMHTITNNDAEHASGQYNKSTKSSIQSEATQFSIGIGTSKESKNAVEVKQNGDVYIKGIGGYDGINWESAKSVQEVINELINKLN